MNSIKILILTLCVITLSLKADTLVLKSGKTYTGTVSITKPGKISIKTKNGTREYDQKIVGMSQLKISAPRDGDKAFKLLDEEKYADALPIFLKWQKRYKNLPTKWYDGALYGIGTCYANLGKDKEGIEILELLLANNPNTSFKSKAEFWLIEMQTRGGNSKEVVGKMQAILVDSSTSEANRAKVHASLGKYYENLQEYNQALENYASVIVLYGDIDDLQEECLAKCAELFSKIGRTNEAKFYYKQLIEAYPQSERIGEAKKQLKLLNNNKGE